MGTVSASFFQKPNIWKNRLVEVAKLYQDDLPDAIER
jgi:hypothetical protein